MELKKSFSIIIIGSCKNTNTGCGYFGIRGKTGDMVCGNRKEHPATYKGCRNSYPSFKFFKRNMTIGIQPTMTMWTMIFPSGDSMG